LFRVILNKDRFKSRIGSASIPKDGCFAFVDTLRRAHKTEPVRAASLLERLRHRGLRLTAQRRVIAEALEGAHVHLTAEEVFERAVARLPEISRATVYNTLNQLHALGEVREIMLDAGPRRYDPNTAKRHQHLICDRCGSVRDVVPLGDISLPPDQRHDFAISDIQVIFRGLCPVCARPHPRSGPGGRKDSKAGPRANSSSLGARRTSAKRASNL
jgi:Fe2+ or Zn2+ uptake regulation protein